MMRLLAVLLFLTGAPAALAQDGAISLAATAIDGQSYSLSLQILVLMTLLTLLPALILSMSAFVRIIISILGFSEVKHIPEAAKMIFIRMRQDEQM